MYVKMITLKKPGNTVSSCKSRSLWMGAYYERMKERKKERKKAETGLIWH
jgi:hypothetical protein